MQLATVRASQAVVPAVNQKPSLQVWHFVALSAKFETETSQLAMLAATVPVLVVWNPATAVLHSLKLVPEIIWQFGMEVLQVRGFVNAICLPETQAKHLSSLIA